MFSTSSSAKRSRQFVVGCVGLDLRMVEIVGAGDQHVGADVLRLHRLRDLLEL